MGVLDMRSRPRTHPDILASKKPVRRATLLEFALRDFLELENILMKLELKGVLHPLNAKQRQHYKQLAKRLHDLVKDLASEVAHEHKAA
jgi:hypothetical protein